MPPIDVPNTVPGLAGYWYRTLDLPNGYQHFNWYEEGPNPNGVILNDAPSLLASLHAAHVADLYLYTQHQIFLQDEVLKHTRSSPNWDGGLVTYSTCKHYMRTANRPTWKGVWLAGLCPKDCADNTVLFVGKVSAQFEGNYHLSSYLLDHAPEVRETKLALTNPRGDVYTPLRKLYGADRYDHYNYEPPQNHTRSVEFYKKSPGSTSDRPDGKVPKWWRDMEYVAHGRQPPSFILSPVWLFSKPTVWSTYSPRRAVLRLTPAALAASLSHSR